MNTRGVASLIVLIWMSCVSFALCSRSMPWLSSGQWLVITQLIYLVAVCLETGYVETGSDSRLRLPTKILALLTFVTVLLSLLGH